MHVVHMVLTFVYHFLHGQKLLSASSMFFFFLHFQNCDLPVTFFCSLEIGNITFVFLPAFSKKNVNSKSCVSPLSFCWKNVKSKGDMFFPTEQVALCFFRCGSTCLIFCVCVFHIFDYLIECRLLLLGVSTMLLFHRFLLALAPQRESVAPSSWFGIWYT